MVTLAYSVTLYAAVKFGRPFMSKIGGFSALALAGPTTSPIVNMVGKPSGRTGGGENVTVVCGPYSAKTAFVTAPGVSPSTLGSIATLPGWTLIPRSAPGLPLFKFAVTFPLTVHSVVAGLFCGNRPYDRLHGYAACRARIISEGAPKCCSRE